MFRGEHCRLKRTFTALLTALLPCAAVQACDRGTLSDASDAGTTDGHGDVSSILGDATGDAYGMEAATDGPTCSVVTTLRDASLSEGDADASDKGCDYALSCGLPPDLAVVGCEIFKGGPEGGPSEGGALGCRVLEGLGCSDGGLRPGDGGAITIGCLDCFGGGGRRPAGLLRARAPLAPTALGAYFARMAHDEAASVHAFRRLREELIFHGAPSALVRLAERSTRDEEHHATVMARYARVEGAPVPSPRVRRSSSPRSLLAIARENAVEGCVHETFGALLLGWQAVCAREPSLRRSFRRIAADETRHAALAWAVARWADGRLSDDERARVLRARSRAVRSLRRSVLARPPSSFEPVVGRPNRVEAMALLDGMVARLACA